jgi:hypothetical protein
MKEKYPKITKIFIFVALTACTRCQNSNYSTIFTSTGAESIKQVSHTRENIAILTSENLIIALGSNPSQTFTKTLSDQPKVKNHSVISCWSHNELCIMCGDGGCVGSSYSNTNLSLHAVYTHRKYS